MACVSAIGLIIWWFWLAKPKTVTVRDDAPVDVLVENGVYAPARIEVRAGKPVTLRLLRRDPSPCAEQVRFDALGVSVDLPVGKPRDVVVTVARPGT
jgi:plastocyanin domain-containing protein